MEIIENPLPEILEASLSLRLLMQGKEVGGIIGKKGDIVRNFREQSKANIFITDGSCPERLVTIAGTTETILAAVNLIAARFGEVLGGSRPVIRLIAPATQCGSLIGKGGSRIKEIREETGCNMQVTSDMLPNSTERVVTLSGSAESITRCVYKICGIMLENPPKGPTIPYRPKPQVAGGPVILAGGQAYTIQGRHAVPSSPDVSKLANSPLSGLLGLGSLINMNPSMNPSGENRTDALAALAGAQLRSPMGTGAGTQSHELTVPNELIGCIIGKGGTKIAEIRQITGAMITISKYDDGSEDASKQDRTITIKGNSDQVALAQYLINTSMELHKAQIDVSKGGHSAAGVNPNVIPLAQLIKNPQALNALSSLTGLQGISSLVAALAPEAQNLAQAVALAQRQRNFQPKMRSSSSNVPQDGSTSPKDTRRGKFAPY